MMSDKKYSKDHEWIILDNEIATIGISNHAQENLGDIVFIDLPQIGKKVNSGDEVSVIESVKAASDIYSPINGEIIEVNKKLLDDASIINKDAENEGWIFKIKVSDTNQINDLMTLENYNEYLKEIK